MTRRAEIVIVGAGVVGAWCALMLARAGRSVLVLEERAEPATRASFGNAGLITVSAAPLTAPGVIGQAIRWSLHPRAPVRIHPRLSPAWAAWAWHFHRACSPDQVARTTEISLRLTRRSATLLDEFAATTNCDFSYRHEGLVACYLTPQAMEAAVAKLDRFVQLGIDARPLDAPAVRAASPLVGPGVIGGVFYPEDAALDPAAMTRAVLDAARRHGAQIETQVRALRLARVSGSPVVHSADGDIVADQVVLTAGFESQALLRAAGATVFIEAGKGYSDDLGLSGRQFGPSLRLAEARVVATPLGRHLRITSRLELGDTSEIPLQHRADHSLRAACAYLDRTRLHQRVRAPWAGLRPMTPDCLPLVGRHPDIADVILATGHGQMGVAHGPATGELVSRLIASDAPAMADALAPARFRMPWSRPTA